MNCQYSKYLSPDDYEPMPQLEDMRTTINAIVEFQDTISSDDASDVVSYNKVYFSGQNTAAAWETISSFSPAHVRASAPAFNHGPCDARPQIEKMSFQVNIPAFGLNVQDAVVSLMDAVGMRLPLEPNEFALSKIANVDMLVDHIQLMEENKEIDGTSYFKRWWGEFKAHCDRNPKCPYTDEEWDAVVKNLPRNWKNNMHFTNIMTNFGLSDGDAYKVSKSKLANGEDVDQKCLRWLTKMLMWKGVPSSFADLVNVVFCILSTGEELGKWKGMAPDEDQIVEKLNVMEAIIRSKMRNPPLLQWVPNVHIHDNELDDMWANSLVQKLWEQLGHPGRLYTVVQLPPFNSVERHRFSTKNFLMETRRIQYNGDSSFFDNHSRNYGVMCRQQRMLMEMLYQLRVPKCPEKVNFVSSAYEFNK